MARITFAATGETVDVKDGSTLLDYCQDRETPVDFACMSGSCGTCRIEVLEGIDSLSAKDEEEQDTLEHIGDGPNYRLGCQITINGDITILQPD